MTTASKRSPFEPFQGLVGVRPAIDEVTDGEQAVPPGFEVDRG